MVGIWLLVPEHLRLGTWDLLCGWTGQDGAQVEPRLALQLVHEAALCVPGLRERRCLSQKGFELANGLPFVASDTAIHDLLAAHTVAEAKALQVALGRIRRASGHYRGGLLAVDPHRIRSYSKRQMRRHRGDNSTKPHKVTQVFFCLDADTTQPLCFTPGTAATTVTQATPGLLELAAAILTPSDGQTLVLADSEHFTAKLIDAIHRDTRFDLLVPMPNQPHFAKRLRALPPDTFTRRWAGFATAKQPYQLTHSTSGPQWLLIQRSGERPDDYDFKGFLCTADREEVDTLTLDYPKRWHIEEFFNTDQDIGWSRAGTQNLHIRYGQMSLALVAQAATTQLRQRLGEPYSRWDASHLADNAFGRLDGDIRVRDDTIVVTYYDAPNTPRLRHHLEHLPAKLRAENIDPRIPWLYDLKLDFCFR